MADRNIPITRGEDAPVREGTLSRENYMKPPVDIFETEEELVMMADIPGVSKENLDIGIDKGILTIRGHAESTLKGDVIYRDFQLSNYSRQFELPETIDAEKTRAEVKNGVLTLHLPKQEAAKPRRIEITSH